MRAGNARKAQPMQFLDIIFRRLRGVVGKKEKFDFALQKRMDQLQRAGDQCLAEVDGAIHIEYKAFQIANWCGHRASLLG